MALNIEELKKLRDRVRSTMEPGSKDRFTMMEWFAVGNDNCGTTACLAGLTEPEMFMEAEEYLQESDCCLSDYGLMQMKAADRARDTLGLSSDKMFYDEFWPEEFYYPHDSWPHEAAIKLLDWIIENEREPEWL